MRSDTTGELADRLRHDRCADAAATSPSGSFPARTVARKYSKIYVQYSTLASLWPRYLATSTQLKMMTSCDLAGYFTLDKVMRPQGDPVHMSSITISPLWHRTNDPIRHQSDTEIMRRNLENIRAGRRTTDPPRALQHRPAGTTLCAPGPIGEQEKDSRREAILAFGSGESGSREAEGIGKERQRMKTTCTETKFMNTREVEILGNSEQVDLAPASSAHKQIITPPDAAYPHLNIPWSSAPARSMSMYCW